MTQSICNLANNCQKCNKNVLRDARNNRPVLNVIVIYGLCHKNLYIFGNNYVPKDFSLRKFESMCFFPKKSISSECYRMVHTLSVGHTKHYEENCSFGKTKINIQCHQHEK